MNLVMAFISCSFDSFSVFFLCVKQEQNFMKIMFSCIHFPVWPYPPKIMGGFKFYTGKLYGLTGMSLCVGRGLGSFVGWVGLWAPSCVCACTRLFRHVYDTLLQGKLFS